jgi:Ca-activated chloride channel family protein
MKKQIFHILFSYFICLSAFALAAQSKPADKEEDPPTYILFLLDASQSMNESWDGAPMFDVARRLINQTVRELKDKPNMHFALRVYGSEYHYSVNNCKDSKLEVGFGPYSHILIPSRLNDIRPKGITPLSYALEESASDFPRRKEARNIIIVMTDGRESCEGDPCAVSAALQKKGIILKPFVIGLGYGSESFTNLDCVGIYYEAKTPDEAKNAMGDIVKKVSDKTTVQINLLDENGHPSETDVNISFISNNRIEANYYHTLNEKGLPDTLEIDPINSYTIKVHTLPPVVRENVSFESGRHNEIDIPAAQGFLKVSMPQSNTLYNKKIDVLISKRGQVYALNEQSINSRGKYLTGKYRVSILTLPPIVLDTVNIRQNSTTEITLPEPGLVSIENKLELVGGIFQMKGNRLSKVVDLNNQLLKQTILLQPGRYQLIYRKKITLRSEETRIKNFEVSMGQSIRIKLD